jgi:adenylate cyclase class 2
MIETETKIAVEDLEEIRRRLTEVKAENQGSVHLIDTYYVFPSQDTPNQAVRIRESDELGERAELTCKTHASASRGVTARHEITVSVIGPAGMHEILVLLGGQVSARIDKSRERYLVSGLPVYLDSVVGLGTFVEIGAPVQTKNVAKMRERIERTVAVLGLQAHTASRKCYFELALEKDHESH